MSAYNLPAGTIVKITDCLVMGEHGPGLMKVHVRTSHDPNGIILAIPVEQIEVQEQ